MDVDLTKIDAGISVDVSREFNQVDLTNAVGRAETAAASAEADLALTNADVVTSGTNATNSQLKAWESEASSLTAYSYANEAEDVPVNLVTSDGDGTFTYTPQAGVYSALHWEAKSVLATADFVLKTGDTMTGNLEAPSMSIGGDYLSPFGFRNYIINGDMRVPQRGTSFTTTVTNQYTLDRWFAGNTGAVVTQGLSGTPSIGNYLSYVTPSALTSHVARVSQAIELPYYLGGKTVTLSFKIYTVSGLDSPFIQFWKGNDANIFATSIATPAFTIPSTGVWHTITTTLTLPTLASDEHLTVSIRYNHINGVQSDMLLAKVQLEEGSVATPFEQRPIGLEEMLCKRYLPLRSSIGSAYSPIGIGIASSTTNLQVVLPLDLYARIKPSSVSYAGNFHVYDGATGFAVTGMTVSALSTDKVIVLNAAVASGLTVGSTYYLRNNNDATAYVEIATEL